MVDRIGRSENLEDRLIEAAHELNKVLPLTINKSTDFMTDNSEAVIVFADWHYGMVTDNIWDRYDTQVCRYRVTKLVERAIERIRLHKCQKLMSYYWGTQLMVQFIQVRVLHQKS